MKVYHPSFFRGVTAALSALFWTSIVGGLAIGLFKFIDLLNRLEHPRRGLSAAADHFVTALLMAAFVLIGILLALQGLLLPGATRYVVGATELTVHSGAIWRRTTTLSLLSITRIEISSSPTMRLFGLADLDLYSTESRLPCVSLQGLRDAEEAKRFLLDRRASLHEAALRGDLMVGHTPQEMQLQRLSDAIERLNARLPRA